MVKIAVFWLFLKDNSNDFAHFFSECEEERYRSAEKESTSKAWSVLEIFIYKVGIFGQNGKQTTRFKDRRIFCRTMHDMENVIRYYELAGMEAVAK